MTLPAGYVRANVELAYATTTHRAQGMTTDTSHVLADATIARESFYVAMTRGRRANDAYLVLDPPRTGQGDHQHAGGSAASEQWTRGEVLHAIATNTGAQSSAHEVIEIEQDRAGSIEQLAAEAETIASHAHDLAAGELLLTVLGDGPTTLALLDDDQFHLVVTAIRSARTAGIDIDTALPGIARPLQARGGLTAVALADAIRTHTTATTTGGQGRSRVLIAGILPDSTAGLTDPQMLISLRRAFGTIDARLVRSPRCRTVLFHWPRGTYR